jgi:DNA-binding PadR family transcriptional regulator
MGPPPRRAERGEVRYLILDAIADQPRHGYDIMQTIESRTGGGYRPSAGTVYPTLQLLEEMGHARTVEKDGRRLYEITDDGRADLDAHREEVDDAHERLGHDIDWETALPDLRALGRRIRRLLRATGRAHRQGTLGKKQLAEIHTVIDEALDRVEEIAGQSRKRRR